VDESEKNLIEASPLHLMAPENLPKTTEYVVFLAILEVNHKQLHCLL
jgi:hypothetical protein